MVEPPELDFDAGQWISVPFGPKVVRAWTILSTPTRKRSITLAVDLAPGGIGSQWLRALKVGDSVPFKGPTGSFVFHRADPRRAVFVAEEIGIVPVRAILAHLTRRATGGRPSSSAGDATLPGCCTTTSSVLLPGAIPASPM